jgi:phenylacetate-CoA ligase
MADGNFQPRREVTRALDRLRRQVIHATMYSPLWRAWISRGGQVPFIESLEDFERLPIVEPSMLRRVSPWALVPAGQRTGLAKSFPSPGPEGTPTWSFWSPSDWRCLVKTLADALGPHRPPGGDLIAYNAHPEGALSGSAYGDALRLLDVAVAPRHCDASRPGEVIHEIASLGCNVMVLGHGDRSPESDSAAAIDRMLSERPHMFEQMGIKWWICTSTAPGRMFLDAATRQGVQSVTRMYGSSDVGLFGVGCAHDLRDYHVTSGHVHVEVVDELGRGVAPGERGRVVVTRFGGMTQDGSVTVNEGSQLVRLAVGDMATLVTEPCSCGASSVRLRDVRRELGPRANAVSVYLADPSPSQPLMKVVQPALVAEPEPAPDPVLELDPDNDLTIPLPLNMPVQTGETVRISIDP